MDLIQERDGNNNVIASYVRDGNIGGVLSRTTSSGTFYYHYDGNGNVVAMTDSSGTTVAEYTYDAYGNLTSMSGSQAADNPIRFSTKYFDGDTGYYDFGFRSYDPVTGRWLNRDPIGEEGGLNLYGFVGNSPGNVLDAYGLNYWKSIESWVNEQLYGKPSKPVNSNEPGADTWALAQSKALADRRGAKVSAKLAETGMCAYGEAASYAMGAGAATRATCGTLKNLPGWKRIRIDVSHILSGHSKDGSRIMAGSKKTLFPSHMTSKQIEKAVREAYRNGSKTGSIQPNGQVKVIGYANGQKILMWVNTKTKTIESAYPIR